MTTNALKWKPITDLFKIQISFLKFIASKPVAIETKSIFLVIVL